MLKDKPGAISRENLFGGVGALRVWNLLPEGARAPFSSVVACELAPAANIGTFREEKNFEVIIVTEGQGIAEVDGIPTSLAPGVVIQVALGQTVAIANDSPTAPLGYLIVKASAPK